MARCSKRRWHRTPAVPDRGVWGRPGCSAGSTKWGLPLPICEYQINDTHDEFVAKVDFIWVPWWFILEYDGDEGHGPRRWKIDDTLEDEIEGFGYRLERADRGDMRPSSTRLFDLLSGILLHPPTGPWPVRRRSEAPRAA